MSRFVNEQNWGLSVKQSVNKRLHDFPEFDASLLTRPYASCVRAFLAGKSLNSISKDGVS